MHLIPRTTDGHLQVMIYASLISRFLLIRLLNRYLVTCGRALSIFFSLGQTLPTHRSAHSKHGGIFQPTMAQAIRLLSSQPFSSTTSNSNTSHSLLSSSLKSLDVADPFTCGTLTYSTNGSDIFTAPSSYTSRRHSWIHVFPEGFIHQHPSVRMRYFKWGVSRLILESEPLPTIIPMFIAGTENVMPESRTFPRFLPRVGKKIRIAFGEEVDGDKVFGDLRAKWKRLVVLQKESIMREGFDAEFPMGELTDELKYGTEAVALRIEVTKRVRAEVLKLRRQLGYPEEEPNAGLVETWAREGQQKGEMSVG